jgi:predicted DNA-binding protein with PD1-like motif
MQYSEGSLGRVFVLRMDHGEDLIEMLQRFVSHKGIESCMVLFIGALLEGRAVTGPEHSAIPPIPHSETFEGAWESFGMATVYPSAQGPKIHIHSALGRGREALAGCIRERAKIYLIVEAVLFEFSGLEAKRSWDENMELQMLALKDRL